MLIGRGSTFVDKETGEVFSLTPLEGPDRFDALTPVGHHPRTRMPTWTPGSDSPGWHLSGAARPGRYREPYTLSPAAAAPSLALAKPVKRVPCAAVLPGGCLYEPKLDGYRVSVVTSETGVVIWSRHGKDLTPYFPDLAAAVAGAARGRKDWMIFNMPSP